MLTRPSADVGPVEACDGTCTASRFDPRFQAFKKHLLAAGKARTLVMVACTRRLLTVLNAMMNLSAATLPNVPRPGGHQQGHPEVGQQKCLSRVGIAIRGRFRRGIDNTPITKHDEGVMISGIPEAVRGRPEFVFAPGDILIAEGQHSPPLFFLLSGAVSVYRGTIRVNTSSVPGALFGEMSVLLDIPSTAAVVADTTVRAARIDDAAAFLAQQPEVALHAARLLAQRLYDSTTYLADLKRQFIEEESHLGMVDRVLDSLLTQQLERPLQPDQDRQDPRL